jgi:hypothetical protein
MSGPPKSATAPAANQGRYLKSIDRSYTPETLGASWWRLCVERFKQGLLNPFTCANCHRLALDPIGRNREREFLCERCADCDFSMPNYREVA